MQSNDPQPTRLAVLLAASALICAVLAAIFISPPPGYRLWLWWALRAAAVALFAMQLAYVAWRRWR